MDSLVILVGGRGRRMGQADKALLPLGGRAFLQRIVQRLGPLFGEILLAGAAPGSYPGLEFRCLPDLHPGGGPLQGIAAGLEAMEGQRAFVCACDMPLVEPAVVERMLSLQPGHDAVAARLAGRLQPLHAVYSRSCLPQARELAREPGVPVARLLDRVDCLYLAEGDLEDLPSWQDSFANANTPLDLEELERRLEGGGPDARAPGPGAS